MITRPTVLILGAGASIPYGFPSGAGLIDYTLTDLPSTPNTSAPSITPRRKLIFDLLCKCHGEEDVVAFSRALGRSGKLSIDAFLESNPPPIREVGKSAIAAEILAAEDPVLISRRGKEDWYRYFYTNVLACSLHQLTNNQLTIITYNYDRSFEYFLMQSFAADCSSTLADAADVVRQLPIYHLHGSIGSLEDLAYGYELCGAAMIRTLSPRIRIISDPDVEQNDTFKRAHVALQNAERIYFLGFGWAPENLRRLIPDGLTSSNREILGTSFGMGSAELNRSLGYYEDRNLHIGASGHTCLDFLRECAFARL
jgi:hypothetical protein